MPKVVAQQRRGWASNPRLLDRKSDALPLSHRATPYCLAFEKIAFLHFVGRQTDRQTNRWTRPSHEAALAVASGGLITEFMQVHANVCKLHLSQLQQNCRNNSSIVRSERLWRFAIKIPVFAVSPPPQIFAVREYESTIHKRICSHSKHLCYATPPGG